MIKLDRIEREQVKELRELANRHSDLMLKILIRLESDLNMSDDNYYLVSKFLDSIRELMRVKKEI